MLATYKFTLENLVQVFGRCRGQRHEIGSHFLFLYYCLISCTCFILLSLFHF